MFELALVFVETWAFPFSFDRAVPGEHPLADLFLCDELSLNLHQLIAEFQFAVQRQANRVGDGIGQVVDDLDGCIAPLSSIPNAVAILVTPIGEVQRNLEVVGHAELKLVTEVDPIEIAIGVLVGFPGDPLFVFRVTGRHGGRFIHEGEPALAGEGGVIGGGRHEHGRGKEKGFRCGVRHRWPSRPVRLGPP